MDATVAVRRSDWTFAQWALVLLASVQLIWATAGLIAQPTFDFGLQAAGSRSCKAAGR